MKRLILLVSMMLLLSGCGFVANEYVSSKPHESENQTQMPEAAEVSDLAGMKDAMVRFIKAGRKSGTIRTVDYKGNVEEDLVQAVYDVARMTPVGAYAVDYISHNCVRIVNYYEISLSITYRRSAGDIASIQQAYSPEQLREQVERSLRIYDEHLAMQVTQEQEYDIAAIVEAYCLANPAIMVEKPKLQVQVFPESGPERIVEVDFIYENTYEELLEKRKAINESVDAAAEYIRYRHSDRDKTQLLYTYLTERFTYTEGKTATPVWSALCEGVADYEGLAQGFRLICEKAGVECHTVSGLRDGEPYVWNIVADDGDFRHIDLGQSIGRGVGLRHMTDWEMNRYYWNAQAYPACVAELPAEPAEEPVPSEPQQEQQEEEET